MNIRIKPPAALSSAEIDLGTLDFPERWLALPPRLDARPNKASMASHAIAQEGEEWCRKNAIDVNETCQYRFDRAVWTVTIIESLLFDCDSGKVVVTFVQEAEEEEYAVIEMKVKLLLDLRSLLAQYITSSLETQEMKNTLRITLFSFCIDVYASFILHELKLMGLLPANYFIWIAQMRRKQLAHALCMKTKEVAQLLYLSCDSLDPELADWIQARTNQPTSDLLDFLLSNNSRSPPSPEDESDDSSMDDTPSTTRVRSTSSDSDSGSSGGSDASDGDSPSPVGVIDIFEQYRNDFHLTSDLLRHIDKRRMRKLLPPKLSQRGLALSSEKKAALEELEEDITLSLNAVRRLEKLIDLEEEKEKKLIDGYQPTKHRSEQSEDSSDDDEASEATYNQRARSPTPYIDRNTKKNKRQSGNKRSAKKRSKKVKTKTKTPEWYDDEWERRQDSPYPRRHAEMIVGGSASEMMMMMMELTSPPSKPKSKPKKAGGTRKNGSDCFPVKNGNKRKLESIQEEDSVPIQKKLKRAMRFTIPNGNRTKDQFDFVGFHEEEDGSGADDEEHDSMIDDDPDYVDEEGKSPKKKSRRRGKDLGHRDDNVIAPSTAAYLASLRSTRSASGSVSNGRISERELEALYIRVSGTGVSVSSSSTSASSSSSAASSSATTVETELLRQNREEGDEAIKTREPLQSKSLSHASSGSNTPPPTTPTRRRRPALRRENSGVHPNAFMIGLPEGFDVRVARASPSSSGAPAKIESRADPEDAEVLTEEGTQEKSSEFEEGLEMDLDFELGILSPEKGRSPRLSDNEVASEGEEEVEMLTDVTWEEVEQMPSSPEQVGAGGPSDVEVDSTGKSRRSQTRTLKASSGSNSSTGLVDERDETQKAEDRVTISKLCQSFHSDVVHRSSDERDDVQRAEDQATILRLCQSLHSEFDNEVDEGDVNFVRHLLQQCGMAGSSTSASGSEISSRSTVDTYRLSATDQENKIVALVRNPRKLKKTRPRPTDDEEAPSSSNGVSKAKAKAIAGFVAGNHFGISRPTGMKLLKSFPALGNSENKSDDDATQIEAKFTAPEEPARNRVTKVYANKRSSKKFCGNSSVNSGGPPKGAEANGTGSGSPHREVSSQLGVNGFLDRLMNDDQRREAEQSQEAMTLSPPRNNTMSNTPLTPTKSIKQKRYPGMLALPVAEQKGKLKEKKTPTSPATTTVTLEGKEKADDGNDWHAGQTIGGSDDKQSIQSDDGEET